VVRTPRGGFGLGCRWRYDRGSNSGAVFSLFISQSPTMRSKSEFDLAFSSERPMVAETEADRALVVEAEWLQRVADEGKFLAIRL
jgi:hypothetical protein